MLILEGIIALLAAIAGALIALGIQQRRIEKSEKQQQAWTAAQTNYLRAWEKQQEKRSGDLETRLITQLQQIQRAWQEWEGKDAARVAALEQEFKVATTQLNLEHELSRLMRIEEIPLTTNARGQQQPSLANWRPAMLRGAKLRERDLSHRYLGYADLREAQLPGATLFMSNLCGAYLVGANLSGADISCADLSGADLRNADLTNVNFLVTDLHKTNLSGANLRGARSLSEQQLRTAIYDDTTLLDPEFDDNPTPPRLTNARRDGTSDTTQSRMEAVHQTTPVLSTEPTPAPDEAAESTPTMEAESTGITNEVPTATEVSVEEIPVPQMEVGSAGEPDGTGGINQAATMETSSADGSDGISTREEMTHNDDVVPAPVVALEDAEMSSEKLAGSVSSTMESQEVPISSGVTEDDSQTGQAQGPHTASPQPLVPTELAPGSTGNSEATPLDLPPDMLSSPWLPDMTSFIDHLDEPASSSPLTSGDSLLDPAVADLLVDTQESTGTEGANTAPAKPKSASKRAAKGS